MTIGVLITQPNNCVAVPRAVFLHENLELHQRCDRSLNQAISTDPEFEIGLKLEYYNQRKFQGGDDGCVIIPFGQISYPEH